MQKSQVFSEKTSLLRPESSKFAKITVFICFLPASGKVAVFSSCYTCEAINVPIAKENLVHHGFGLVLHSN
jgi:hypothetical protein